jgi:hypothetical protein
VNIFTRLPLAYSIVVGIASFGCKPAKNDDANQSIINYRGGRTELEIPRFGGTSVKLSFRNDVISERSYRVIEVSFDQIKNRGPQLSLCTEEDVKNSLATGVLVECQRLSRGQRVRAGKGVLVLFDPKAQLIAYTMLAKLGDQGDAAVTWDDRDDGDTTKLSFRSDSFTKRPYKVVQVAPETLNNRIGEFYLCPDKEVLDSFDTGAFVQCTRISTENLLTASNQALALIDHTAKQLSVSFLAKLRKSDSVKIADEGGSSSPSWNS